MTSTLVRCLLTTAGATLIVAAAPRISSAQTDHWVATIRPLSSGGTADLTVEPRNKDQSRAKLVVNGVRAVGSKKGEILLAWDIVEGSCRDEGKPITGPGAFTTLQAQMDGAGNASANVPKLESGKKYYLRVYNPTNPPTDATAYGCANLSEKP